MVDEGPAQRRSSRGSGQRWTTRLSRGGATALRRSHDAAKAATEKAQIADMHAMASESTPRRRPCDATGIPPKTFDVHVAINCVRPESQRYGLPEVDEPLRRALEEARDKFVASGEALEEAISASEAADAEAHRKRQARSSNALPGGIVPTDARQLQSRLEADRRRATPTANSPHTPEAVSRWGGRECSSLCRSG